MAGNLTGQVRNIAEVTTAVANGDLSKKITVDVKGEILELKNTINTMVDQLNSFASEVTRVAREVGTEGKLGGQAEVQGVAGTWKDLTDNVNFMAGNLTAQVRNIADVTTAVANGDLSKQNLRSTRKARSLELEEHDQHDGRTLDDVRRPGDHAWPRSRYRRQARRPGPGAGRRRQWSDLTDNVNQLAANLTTQVRAIAEVATAVTKGDLTRSITVGSAGRSRCAEGQHQRDDPQPEGHDAEERRAGLAEDQPRQVHPHAAGPARSLPPYPTSSCRRSPPW